MTIGFTGTQRGLTTPQRVALDRVLIALSPTMAHHGDCIGADAEFREMLPDSVWVVCHPPDVGRRRAYTAADEFMKPREYVVRNHAIVDACRVLIACPDGPERLRSGTWSTVRYARRKERRIALVWPSGVVTLENFLPGVTL